MGTNALPYVMDDIRAEPKLKDRIATRLNGWFPSLKLSVPKVDARWARGIAALEVFGPAAKAHLPELVQMVSNSTGYAESALIAIGPDALPAFTNILNGSKFPKTGNLIGAFANAVSANRIKPEQAAAALPFVVNVFQSTDNHGRWYAASALGAIHHDPDLCIPLLIDGLSDPNPSVRSSCVNSLGSFGESASPHAAKLASIYDSTDPLTQTAICRTFANLKSAASISVPVLIRALQAQDLSMSVAAASALGQLADQPAARMAIPALSEATRDSRSMVRMFSIQSLSFFGSWATNEIIIIERALTDPDASVRITATNSIKRLRF